MRDTQTSGLGFVGQSVPRVEDARLLTGRGRFVADVDPPGVLHAAFLRSPYPHATIARVDAGAARRAPGVHAVFTGAEINARTHPFPPFLMLPGLYTPPFQAMAADKVRFAGDLVALVLADSRARAEDALELIEVDYELLTPVATMAQALNPSSQPVWAKAGSNVLYDHTDTYGEVDSVFAGADRVFTERFSCARQSNQPMETRGSVYELDPATGHLTVHSATQSSHLLRWAIAALTDKRSMRGSLRSVVANKQRRAAFLHGAKSFLGEQKENLAKQDNRGTAQQMKKDPATLLHLNRIGLGLLGRDDFPTVVAQDLGGGFGSKGAVGREEVALAAAAIDLGRSVKWIEDRVESLLDGGHAREEDLTMSVAVDDDGTLRGLRVDLVVDQGAFPGFPIGAAFITRIMKVMFPGAYRFEAFELRTRVVSTNKGRYLAYRGPWANETWARERIIDVAARGLRLSPVEIRRKNMFGDEHYPATMITGPTLDTTMSTRKTLDRAVEVVESWFGAAGAGLAAFETARAEAAAAGRHLGLGFACYHEAAPGPPDYFDAINPGSGMFTAEEARTTVEADGSIVVYTSQMPHGQSHQTTYAQVVADELGVALDAVELVWGDTERTPFSLLGTGGSRGGPIGGGAAKYSAREVRRLVNERAADLLEASPDDIEIIGGNIHVAGVPARGMTYAELAAEVTKTPGQADTGRAFDVVQSYAGKGDGGWSCATHVCVVDLDLDTGKVRIPHYAVVEDCGPIINPAIVDGQVRGGVAQGIGAVLYEHAAYDDAGNLQTTTYLDYLIPTAAEIPHVEVHHLETHSEGGENDFRGVGEGGMIGAPAALTNAIEDALASRGVRITEQYLPPYRILELAGVIAPD